MNTEQSQNKINITCKDGTTRVIRTDLNPKEAGPLGRHLEGDQYLSSSLDNKPIEYSIKTNPFAKTKEEKDFLKLQKSLFKKKIRETYPKLKHLPVETIWKINLSTTKPE